MKQVKMPLFLRCPDCDLWDKFKDHNSGICRARPPKGGSHQPITNSSDGCSYYWQVRLVQEMVKSYGTDDS